MSKTPVSIARGAPLLGEHNEYVYCDVLGLSKAELQQMIKDGIVD
jgi:crotonobetainyl-CoA:carnitine CoA-transferase CaiB-like acyl-CoA transferase